MRAKRTAGFSKAKLLSGVKSNYYCLICWNNIEIRRLTCQSGEKLNQIFEVLKIYMNWEEVKKKFEFKTEMFPFCVACTNVITRMYDLNDQVVELLKQIHKLTANVTSQIMLSEGRDQACLKDKSEEPVEGAWYDVEKLRLYRHKTVQNLTPVVKVSRLKEGRIESEEGRKNKSNNLQDSPSQERRCIEEASHSDLDTSNFDIDIDLDEIKEEVLFDDIDNDNHDDLITFFEDDKIDRLLETDKNISVAKEAVEKKTNTVNAKTPDDPDYDPGITDKLKMFMSSSGKNCSETNADGTIRLRKRSVLRPGENRPKRVQQPYRLVEVSPNIFAYRNKYRMKKISDTRYDCLECSSKQHSYISGSRHLYFGHYCKELGKYNCLVCGKVFGRRYDLRSHMKVHTHEKPFKCDICHKDYARSSQVAQHKKRMHSNKRRQNKSYEAMRKKTLIFEQGPVNVPKENVTTENSVPKPVGDEVSDAETSKANISNLQGKVGKKELRSKRLVEISPNVFILADKYKIKKISDNHWDCLECPGVVSSFTAASAHAFTHACQDSNIIRCSTCRRIFSSVEEMKIHKKQMHYTKRFNCETCGRGFYRKSDLRTHVEKKKCQQPSLENKSSDTVMEGSNISDEITDLDVESNQSQIISVPPEITNLDIGGVVEVASEVAVPSLGSSLIGSELDTPGEFPSANNLTTESNLVATSVQPEVASAAKKPLRKRKSKKRNPGENQPKVVGKPYRLVEVSPNIFAYRDKYRIKKISDTRYDCLECSRILPTYISGSRHLYFAHYCKGLGKYKCQECGKVFGRKYDVRTHQSVHTNEKPFKCDICQKGFSRIGQLRQHKRRMHNVHNPEENFQSCTLNSSLSNDSVATEGSVAKAFGDKESDATGDGKETNSAANTAPRKGRPKKAVLENSDSAGTAAGTDGVESSEKKGRIIRKRRMKFRRNRKNALHEVSPGLLTYKGKYEVRRLEPDKYECVKCGKTHTKLKAMYRHVYFHDCMDSKRYRCEICGEVFSRKHDLDLHVPDHSMMKPYKCVCCGEFFASVIKLNKHRRKNHADVPRNLIRDAVCEHCGKSFINPHMLIRHLPIHTGIIFKPVMCEICGVTVTKYRLKNHMIQHTGPQFPCPQCDKKLTSNVILQKHIRIKHAGLREVTCEECGKQFTRKHSLVYHKNRYHSEISEELNKKKRKLPPPGKGKYPCEICGKKLYRADSMKGHMQRYHSERTPELDRQLKEKLSKRKNQRQVSPTSESDDEFMEFLLP